MRKLAIILFFSIVTSISGQNFTNPVIWQDFADLDIIRVNETFYYSASTMHYSPGAPILRSYDLVNWEWVGHSVPTLDFDAKYDLMPNQHGYVRGIWASFFNYRKSNNMFYWGGCIDFYHTYIYSSPSVEGPWSQLTMIDKCYYDCGLLIDDDDSMYVVYTADGGFHVAQLSSDGKSEVKNQQVFNGSDDLGYLEGARFYKRNGSYYIFTDHPSTAQYILKADKPFGSYTSPHKVIDNIKSPIPNADAPHQGGLVNLPNGQWYYMAFVDVYPGGRIPVLAPIIWSADGWPEVQTDNFNGWGQTYPAPLPEHPVKPLIGVDTFNGSKLGPQYEWNHNPDTSRFSVNNGLHLETATITQDLYAARNTITHRIQGPTSTATVTIDLSAMKDGDRTGLAMLKDLSAYIGVKLDQSKYKLIMVNGIAMEHDEDQDTWHTANNGTEINNLDLAATKIHLRVQADIQPGTDKQAYFFYSTDGNSFYPLGTPLLLDGDWPFFMGYRFAIFNYATISLGGSVTVERFEVSTP